MFKYVQSRPYRAPEVFLEIPYSAQIDMWSFGSIIYELHFGEVLFSSDMARTPLEKIVEVRRESIPKYMRESSHLEMKFSSVKDLFVLMNLIIIGEE
jgi:dual specificity tyrosine-phosphorylation-regulated kinase 1